MSKIKWKKSCEGYLQKAYLRHEIDSRLIYPYFNPVSVRRAKKGIFFGELDLYLVIETVSDGYAGVHYLNGRNNSVFFRTGVETIHRGISISSLEKALESLCIDRFVFAKSLEELQFDNAHEKLNLDGLMRLLKLKDEFKETDLKKIEVSKAALELAKLTKVAAEVLDREKAKLKKEKK